MNHTLPTLPLVQLPRGAKAQIIEIKGNTHLSLRLLEMGFIPGTHLQLISRLLWGGSLAISLRGSMVALRQTDAQNILVSPLEKS